MQELENTTTRNVGSGFRVLCIMQEPTTHKYSQRENKTRILFAD
jgi:hypothetical protein